MEGQTTFGEPLEVGGRKWLLEDLVLERFKALEDDREELLRSIDSLRIENQSLYETLLDGPSVVARRLGVARKTVKVLRDDLDRARKLLAAAGEPYVLDAVEELERAKSIHGWTVDRFEAIAVIAEELGEVAQAALDLKNYRGGDDETRDSLRKDLRAEAVQLAAMGLRFLENLVDEPEPVREPEPEPGPVEEADVFCALLRDSDRLARALRSEAYARRKLVDDDSEIAVRAAVQTSIERQKVEDEIIATIHGLRRVQGVARPLDHPALERELDRYVEASEEIAVLDQTSRFLEGKLDDDGGRG